MSKTVFILGCLVLALVATTTAVKLETRFAMEDRV